VANKADGDKRIALSVIVFPPEMNGAAEGNAVYDPLPDTTLFRRHAYRRQHDQRQRQVYQPWRECSPRQQRYDQRERRDRDGKGRREVCNLTYKGGEQNIVIPPTAPVVAFVPGAASIATSGAPVFVLSDDTNGKIIAGLVAVGSNGLTPPF
jgi:hypothetical protein